VNALELVGITKSFGALRAVDAASLRLERGRVHAIVGENGAGKSTLLKIAAGVLDADAGQILIDGEPLRPATAREAARRGLGMVHQHFMLVPTLTGRENLALGVEPTRFGMLDLRAASARAEALAQELDLPLRLDVPIELLSIGERQRLEIVRVLARAGRRGVLVLDEPTAVLGPSDSKALLVLIRKLADDGAAVALVTHRLDEVVACADEVTVMRRGKIVATHAAGSNELRDARALARDALGEDVAEVVRPPRPASLRSGEGATAPRAALELVDVAAHSSEGGRLDGVSLQVERGEIVGVAGVEGNGQHELELAITGLLRLDAGRVAIGGRDVTALDVAGRRRGGLAWIPGDRHVHGVAATLAVTDVLRLGALGEARRPGSPWIDEAVLQAAFRDAVERLDLRPDDPGALVEELSGGNQQKVVVARELRGAPALLLAVHPTRGVDARAAMRIHGRLVAAAEAGAGVLLISSDLAEIRALSHRIVVLRKGRFVAELAPGREGEVELDVIGAAMLGGEA
jgi:simple sugar transport system ATP-binding protein